MTMDTCDRKFPLCDLRCNLPKGDHVNHAFRGRSGDMKVDLQWVQDVQTTVNLDDFQKTFTDPYAQYK